MRKFLDYEGLKQYNRLLTGIDNKVNNEAYNYAQGYKNASGFSLSLLDIVIDNYTKQSSGSIHFSTPVIADYDYNSPVQISDLYCIRYNEYYFTCVCEGLDITHGEVEDQVTGFTLNSSILYNELPDNCVDASTIQLFKFTINEGYHSNTVVGAYNISSNRVNHVSGHTNCVMSEYSSAEGIRNRIIAGNFSHIEGRYNLINAPSKGGIHVEGTQNEAYAGIVHIEGQGNICYSTSSHVGGYSNVVGVEGNDVTGRWTVMYGRENRSAAELSTTFGQYNVNNSNRGFVGGYNNKIFGENTLAFGQYLSSTQNNQVVFGKYNQDVEGYLVVGCGTSAHPTYGLKNALEIGYDGKINILDVNSNKINLQDILSSLNTNITNLKSTSTSLSNKITVTNSNVTSLNKDIINLRNDFESYVDTQRTYTDDFTAQSYLNVTGVSQTLRVKGNQTDEITIIQVKDNRNLLDIPSTFRMTRCGITLTANTDGTLTANGTFDGSGWPQFIIKDSSYFFSQHPYHYHFKCLEETASIKITAYNSYLDQDLTWGNASGDCFSVSDEYFRSGIKKLFIQLEKRNYVNEIISPVMICSENPTFDWTGISFTKPSITSYTANNGVLIEVPNNHMILICNNDYLYCCMYDLPRLDVAENDIKSLKEYTRMLNNNLNQVMNALKQYHNWLPSY